LILQELKHPEAYPIESPMERRDRLINIISYMIVRDKKIPDIRKFQEEKTVQETARPKENEIFYTEEGLELKNIRMEIAKYSLPRAAHRIEVAKKKFMEIDRIQESIDYEKYLNDIKDFEFVASQFVDDRGCTRGAISPDENFYGISGVSGLCTILSMFIKIL
jgi:U4/U6 small nuclear ribonucleoprotein PRP4